MDLYRQGHAHKVPVPAFMVYMKILLASSEITFSNEKASKNNVGRMMIEILGPCAKEIYTEESGFVNFTYPDCGQMQTFKLEAEEEASSSDEEAYSDPEAAGNQ